MKLQWGLNSPKTTTEQLHHVRDPPLSFCLIFDSLVLADGFTVFHWHLSLVGTHLFALPALWNKQLHIRKVVCIQFLAIKSQSAPNDHVWSLVVIHPYVCVQAVWVSHLSWMSLSCRVCCSWTVAKSFLRCSHCWVTWLSFISCSSLLWLLISSDHSLVCCAVMSFTCMQTHKSASITHS